MTHPPVADEPGMQGVGACLDGTGLSPSVEPKVSPPDGASIPRAGNWSPITELEAIADEAFARWDKDMRSGKLMLGLSGDLPRYRGDVTSVRLACAVAPGLLSTIRAIDIIARRQGSFGTVTPTQALKMIRGFTCDEELGRMFAVMPAQAMEARQGGDGEAGSVHDSAVLQGCAPNTWEHPHD